jgi:two-component system sensor histidine kinase GlrK
MRMSLWQPRSVLQLVTISICVTLAPLGLAIFFTVDTLSELADRNRTVTALVVDATRLEQAVQRDVLELERRARQFMALGDLEIGELYQTEHSRLIDNLRSLRSRVPGPAPEVSALVHMLDDLALRDIEALRLQDQDGAGATASSHLNSRFTDIGQRGRAIQAWLQATMDTLLENTTREADSLLARLSWQLSLLGLTTLLSLLFFAWWINRPIRDLTQEIHQLGTEGLSHRIEISGPEELQALGSKLEWMRQQLQESQDQKEQFLRHISHELKTPLASLREGADLLSDQVAGRLSQQQREIVEIVRQNAIELQRLIENLLDFNHVPEQALTYEDIDLRGLFRELLANYHIAIDRKGLELDLAGDVDYWRVDQKKLRTSLDNLLSNAINYTPAGGTIDVQWHREGDNLVINVANSGEPIPPEDSERVFEPFFQSTSQRTGPIKGSGIGLSVARECIEAQGGSLSLAPHYKLPICFCLTCPAH